MKTTTYSIPTAQVPSTLKRLKALSTKRVKGGLSPLTITVGEEFRESRLTRGDDLLWVGMTPVTVTLNTPPSRWRFEGRITHQVLNGEAMNLVKMTPSTSVQDTSAWRTALNTCDHCHTKRFRKDTFIVSNVDGTIFRVGKSCLKDFLGDSVEEILLGYSVQDACDPLALEADPYPRYFYSTEEVVAVTSAILRKHPWVSRTKARDTNIKSTADDVEQYFIQKYNSYVAGAIEAMSSEDVKIAREAIAWAKGFDAGCSDYEHNLKAVLSFESIPSKDFGVACSVVPAYKRHLEKKMELDNLPASEYAGKVGDKFGGKGKGRLPELTAKVLRLYTFEGTFGTSTIVSMRTTDGADLKWFATGTIDSDVSSGKTVKVAGSVKKLEVDKVSGRKTTFLTHCRLTVVA